MTEHGFWPGSFLAALARGTHRALPMPPARHPAETPPGTIGESLRPHPPTAATAAPTSPEARLIPPG
jgi:hypothetical protein